MKLASLKSGRDGQLVVVSKDLKRAVAVPSIAQTLQTVMDDWSNLSPKLEEVYAQINKGKVDGEFDFDPEKCAAPLPRAYHWVDGSAYVHHVQLVRKARGAEVPESFWTDPLVYQGGSDILLGARDDILVGSEEYGIDMEAEVAVITDDVPMATSAEDAGKHIKLLMIVNDVSLRNLIPNELKKGFGFYQGKPPTAFSPVAVTQDELGDSYKDSVVHLPLKTYLNGDLMGEPDCNQELTFNFRQLIEHVSKTRPLGAGTIIGSGTVSNADRSKGSSCLAEKRMLEIIDGGKATTEFMRFGDKVKIDMTDASGASIFGSIEQTVVEAKVPVKTK